MLKTATITPVNIWERASLSRHGFALSHLPPIGEGAKPWLESEKRRINHRWLYGTVLTGAAGALLMGIAVWGSVEKDSTDRHSAQTIATSSLSQNKARFVERISNVARKGDKLSLVTDSFITTKQVLRVSTSTKVGNNEVVKVRPYAKVAVNLVTSSTERAAEVPAFNAVKLMSGDNTAIEAAEDTAGDITFTTKDLTQSALDQATFIVPTNREVLERVHDLAQSIANTANPIALPSFNSTLAINATNNQLVTNLDKSPIQKSTINQPHDRTLTAKDGETVVALLLEAGASRDDARNIATAYNKTGQDLTLKTGNQLRVTFTRNKQGTFQPARITLNVNSRDASVALADDGRYLTLDQTKILEAQKKSAEDEEEDEGTMKLYNAIYETALKQEVPKKVIEEIIRIFAYDIDFNKAVQSGDKLELFYGTEDDMDRGDVLFASLTTGDETRKYYRFLSPDDGLMDYYDEKGKSAKKFLVRKPMQDGLFRSGFGMRRHPIYGYGRMHSGVDWSARTGTPIVAAGNGTIDLAERQSGYGNRIEIQHSNGYRTTYSHMVRFAKGMKEGARVSQGQVIGFVGSTGQSTGPHLHYEVEVNGSYVDPLRVRVPRGREFEGSLLSNFHKERQRIDGFLNRREGLQAAVSN